MPRRLATYSGNAILLLTVISLLAALLPYGYILTIIGAFLILKQIIIRMVFEGPKYRSPPFSDPDWEVIIADNKGVDVYGFYNLHENDADLVIFIHGWQSSSKKFVDRMNLYRSRGLHTLAIDMRGHGMAPDTYEWTAGKVIEDVKVLLDSIDRTKVKKTHFFGHSLGAFICLGLQNDRHTGWWKDDCSTIILESPMVAYSLIMEEMTSKISFMLPLIKKWAVNRFNIIHPEVGGLNWNDIDIPNWGLPSVPTLLLQAANDTRLGRGHYDLMLKQDIDLYPHLIDSLTHSNNKINDERDAIMLKWIEEKIL